jgi:murein DD-endopeptidase MepM/ murein hydrolase activator NlpD
LADTIFSEADSHLWVGRPVGLGGSNWPAANYPYGSTKGGTLAVHHGVDFAANYGTPLVSVAAGEIIVAGGDQDVLYGLRPDFYGLLVVIRLDQTYRGQPVYVLYAHLSEILVEVGQRVEPGELIAESGASGAALGAHLHLEVRVGENDYAHTRNPQLWMLPFDDRGAIAVRVVDRNGQLLADFPVLLSRAASPRSLYRGSWTYTDNHVNGDDLFGENAVFGEIPPGPYWVRAVVDGHEFAVPALVVSRRTTVVTLELPVP